MDTLLPHRKYAMFVPQVGVRDERFMNSWLKVKDVLEAGGAEIVRAESVPGLVHIQFVEIVSDEPAEHDPNQRSIFDVISAPVDSSTDRARETKSFGS